MKAKFLISVLYHRPTFLALVLSLTTFIFAWCPVEARALTHHVLLVGVSDYLHLDPRDRLNGPREDVRLMRVVLEKLGIPARNITVLADGIDNASGSPTRQAILSALDGLSRTVQRDDVVYIHYSGHGSQEPATADHANEEPDGLDEIILPIDVGHWDGSVGHVENAFTDYEIRDAVVAIRNRGAFVWLVFDACHAGTMTRGITVDERDRRVDPQALGIPTSAMPDVRARGGTIEEKTELSESRSLQPNAGGYVAFFAAQTDETTPERRLPEGDPERRSHGIFTFTLAKALSSHPGITYRQAAEQIIYRYSVQRERTTPLFEGTGLDTPILGVVGGGERLYQWPVRKEGEQLRLSAGSLHQIGPGTRMILLPSPVASEQEALGYAEVEQSQLTASTLRLVARENRSLPTWESLPNQLVARVVERRFSLSLKVALPPKTEKQTGPAALLVQAVETLRQGDAVALRLDWVEPGQEADVRLVIRNGQLWFLPPNAELVEQGAGKTPSLVGHGDVKELRDKLTDSLLRIGKVTNLLRLGGEILTQNGRAGKLRVGGIVRRVDRQSVGVPRPEHMQCRNLPRLASEPIGLSQIPSLRDCDEIAVDVENLGERPIDLTLLFISADFAIDPLFPYDGEVNRIEAHGRLPIQPFMVRARDAATGEPLTTGRERILFIAVEAEKNAHQAEFTFLAQKELPKSRGGTKGGGLLALLEEAGFAASGKEEQSRGGIQRTPVTALDKADIRVLNWETNVAR